MSIARVPAKNPENGTTRFSIDMQDLKDLKRCFHGGGARGGQAPALREHRDLESAHTVLHRDQEVSPTGKASIYEIPAIQY